MKLGELGWFRVECAWCSSSDVHMKLIKDDLAAIHCKNCNMVEVLRLKPHDVTDKLKPVI